MEKITSRKNPFIAQLRALAADASALVKKIRG